MTEPTAASLFRLSIMRSVHVFPVLLVVATGAIACRGVVMAPGHDSASRKPSTTGSGATKEAKPLDDDDVVRTEEEWKAILTPEQFAVLRKKGTEEAFTGRLLNNHEAGTYVCAACDNPLFASETKFDSGTGWPSFWAPLSEKSVRTEMDNNLLPPAPEVHCRRCGGHLGHVFDDGPKPSGQRYCMNSVSLKFVKRESAMAK